MRLRMQTRVRGLSFESFGVSMELVTEDPAVEARAIEILPPGWRPCPPDHEATSFVLRDRREDGYEVVVGGATFMEGGSLEIALGVLDSHIRLHVAAHATEWTFVHAGVVGLGERVLVIPGESFSGKSTLVKALVERGADYYSDEYAVLDRTGRVHPYPRPLRIRSVTATGEREVVSPAATVAGAAEIAVVALTRYVPDGEWQPASLPRGYGLALMLTNVVAAQVRPRVSLEVLTRALQGAMVLRSDRGEAGPVADALLRTLARG